MSDEERPTLAAILKKRERDRDWTPKVLSLGILICYAVVQWHIITSIVDPSMREMVMRSLGTLDSLIGFVFGYYFGASFTPKKQTDEIKKDQ